MTMDVERSILFGIGSVTRDFDGGDRKGPNPTAPSALDAATGKLKWYFKPPITTMGPRPHAPPILIDVVRKGKRFRPSPFPRSRSPVIDRVTGKPIYDVEERPVANDNTVPGDEPGPLSRSR